MAVLLIGVTTSGRGDAAYIDTNKNYSAGESLIADGGLWLAGICGCLQDTGVTEGSEVRTPNACSSHTSAP